MPRKWIAILTMMLLLIIPISAQAKTSESLKKEKIYNILIDRYNNGHQTHSDAVDINNPHAYHGGDFKGIEMKLDAIQAAGFTTISISVVAKNSPGGYHGYWIEDFQAINEEFGTIEELQSLVQNAHENDLKVVLEFVTGYAAKSNVLFDDNKHQDWILTENVKLDEPWNEDIVQLDLKNPKVEDYFLETAAFWLEETNVDGLMLHAADQLPYTFVESFSNKFKEDYPEKWLIANTLYANDAAEKLKNIEFLDAVQNRELQTKLFDVFGEVKNEIDSLYEDDAGLIFIDDAYTKRFAQHVGENGRNSTTLWKLALTYMYTANGVPSIYQGSEFPMFAEGYPESQMLVQFNSGDPDLKEFIERIGALRREFPVLSTGNYEFVGSTGAMGVFKRSNEEETFYIAINNDDRSQAVVVDDLVADKQLSGYLADNLVRQNDKGEYVITLPRESSEIFRVEEDKGINWLFIGFIVTVIVVFVAGVIYLVRKDKKRSQS